MEECTDGGQHFHDKKRNHQHGLYVTPTWPCRLWTRRLRRLPLGRLIFCFRVIAIDPWPFLRKSGSLLVVSSKPMQLQREIPTAFVIGATEQILQPHVSCQDPPSKSLEQWSLESPALLILTHSIANFRWLQPACVEHFRVFCLLKAFQNVDQFPRIPNHLWSFGTTIVSGLYSLNHPWKPS